MPVSSCLKKALCGDVITSLRQFCLKIDPALIETSVRESVTASTFHCFPLLVIFDHASLVCERVLKVYLAQC